MIDPKQQAFTRAYHNCHDALSKYCRSLCSTPADAEDLMQDVTLAAYKNFHRIKDKAQLLHYLIRAARNRYISQLRRKHLQPSPLPSDQLLASSMSEQVNAKLDAELLYRMLRFLPQPQREALVLYELCGYSHREISVLQDASVSAVKTRCSRARTQLRTLLQERPRTDSSGAVLPAGMALQLILHSASQPAPGGASLLLNAVFGAASRWTVVGSIFSFSSSAFSVGSFSIACLLGGLLCLFPASESSIPRGKLHAHDLETSLSQTTAMGNSFASPLVPVGQWPSYSEGIGLTRQQMNGPKRQLSPYRHLDISGLANVYINRGERDYAQVEVSGMPREKLFTEVRNDTLYVGTTGMHHGEEIRVDIYADQLNSIQVSGAATISSVGALRMDTLILWGIHPGEATLDLDVEELIVQLQGADLTLRGRSTRTTFYRDETSAHLGKLDTRDLATEQRWH